MENYPVVLLMILAAAAAVGLALGAAQDASNYLTSALGCRAARLRSLLAVAAIGILSGSIFSGNLMGAVRSGVFRAQYFVVEDVYWLLTAASLASLACNRVLGKLQLPTSTTLSFLFSLIGAACSAAVFRAAGSGSSGMLSAVNQESAFSLVGGTLVYMAAAFFGAAALQFFLRLIFTFRLENTYRRYAGLFAAAGFTLLTDFLVIRLAAVNHFFSTNTAIWLLGHEAEIAAYIFCLYAVIFLTLSLCTAINVLKLLVLAATAACAFAFAANDLANFAGFALAAFDAARNTHGDPATQYMTAFAFPFHTQPLLLLVAGAVMAVPLVLVSRVRNQLRCDINVALAQGSDHERFGSSRASRIIVRTLLNAKPQVMFFLPSSCREFIKHRFAASPTKSSRCAFDEVRASTTLITGALLIAGACRHDMPVSTTFIFFMTTLGSGLGDGSWNRENAVYRISGMLSAGAGWLITAAVAFFSSVLLCVALLWGGVTAALAAALAVAVLFALSRRNAQNSTWSVPTMPSHADHETVRRMVNEACAPLLSRMTKLYAATAAAFLSEREDQLQKAQEEAADLVDQLTELRALYYEMAQQSSSSKKLDLDARYCYYRIFANMLLAAKAELFLATTAYQHVADRHRNFVNPLAKNLQELTTGLTELSIPEQGRFSLRAIRTNGPGLLLVISRMQSDLLSSISSCGLSMRSCELYLSFLQCARDIVDRFQIAAILQDQLNDFCDRVEERGFIVRPVRLETRSIIPAPRTPAANSPRFPKK